MTSSPTCAEILIGPLPGLLPIGVPRAVDPVRADQSRRVPEPVRVVRHGLVTGYPVDPPRAYLAAAPDCQAG